MRFQSALVGGLIAVVAGGAAAAGELVGTAWTTEDGSARIAFTRESDGLVGRIVWLRDPSGPDGGPAVDEHNPDKAMRSRPILGLPMLWGLLPTEPDTWDHGHVYSADDGRTYNVKVKVNGDLLYLTGCIRWPLCGGTKWTRASLEMPHGEAVAANASEQHGAK
jgi:uncharacterized protein (DUF2147 family)